MGWFFFFLYRANVESVDEENVEGLSLEEVNISPKIAEGLYSEERCSENVLEHDDCSMQPSYDTCVCLHAMLPKVQKKTKWCRIWSVADQLISSYTNESNAT